MMKYVYIEAKDDHQPEYNFLLTFVKHIGLNDVVLVPVDGKDNLPNQEVQLKQNILEGNRVAILFDADNPNNNGGFSIRVLEINSKLKQMQIKAPIFLWPNNHDDGDFEMMLEHIVRADLHSIFFDCFHDYEECVKSQYNVPNRKGKFHTFVTAQKELSNAQRSRIGRGDWLFNDPNMWDLDSPYLKPLKNFMMSL